MKRMIVGIATATLIGGGFAAVSAESASAACPYTGCVPTTTRVEVTNAPLSRGDKAKICVSVSTTGSGAAVGRVNVSVKRTKGGFRYLDSKTYNDERECFTTQKIKKLGKYVVRANFEAKSGSAFGDSDQYTAFKVRKG